MNMIPPSLAPPRRWEGIGPLRGLVCLSILFGHLYLGTLLPKLTALFGEWFNEALLWRLGFQSMFLLAGFFLAYSLRQSETNYLSISQFASRRMLRLAVPYWAAMLLAFLDLWLPAVLLGHETGTPSGMNLLWQALFVQDLFGTPTMNLILWSMATLIQYTMIVLTVFWLARLVALRRWPERHHAVAESTLQVVSVLAFAGALTLMLVGPRLTMPSDANVWQLPRTAQYFTLGACVYWVASGRLSGWAAVALILVMLVAGVASGSHRLITGALTGVLLWAMATRTLVLPRWRVLAGLALIGEASYSIYLTHGVIGHRVLNLTNHFPNLGSVGTLVFFAASIVASLAFGFAFYLAIERPLMARSRSILYRR